MALFVPFRVLGLVTDGNTPFVTQRRGSETFITTSVGTSWQIYNASSLRVRLIGPDVCHASSRKRDARISCLGCKGDLTFAAVGDCVVECKRLHRRGVYTLEKGSGDSVREILVLGSMLVGRTQKDIVMWNIGEYGEPIHSMLIPIRDATFEPTCMAHPPTYVNKIIVGSSDGRMQLWNIVTGKLLYEFAAMSHCSIECLVPSSALDVIAVGLMDGSAVVKDIRRDVTMLELKNAAGAGAKADAYLTNSVNNIANRSLESSCSCIAFNSGSLMATAGTAGVISVWNLETQTIHAIIRDAHDGPVSHMEFLAGQPILVTTSMDNSIKQWIFDGTDGQPRLLRFRNGHSSPPTIVRHYADSTRLLSGGQDRAFRYFSTIQDSQNRELSQGHLKKRAKRLKIAEEELKLTRIISLDACDVREKDWSNVITAHDNDVAAYVWRIQKFAQGEFALVPPQKDIDAAIEPVTCVCLSKCGNFGFVGSQAGRIDRYNMQSGLHRGKYSMPDADHAHMGAVTGLATDGCNRYLVSGGLDDKVKCWNLKSRNLEGEIDLGSKVSMISFHPTTCLVAVACDDGTIRLCDVEARTIVRRFRGHQDRITDLQFSQDCRWLLSSSMDSTLRVWDVPGSTVLQVLKMESPITSFSLSPNMDVLVTTHTQKVGIYTWANQLIFGALDSIVASNKPISARLPRVSPKHVSKSNLDGKGAQTPHAEMLQHSTRGKGQVQTSSSSSMSNDTQEESSIVDESSSSDSDDNDEAEESGKKNGKATISERDQDVLHGKIPVAPKMITLSMLPRSQWLNLIHIDTIKTRNKPIEPPKKPEAAPFFLPTVSGANAGRDPVFATQSAEEEEERIAKNAAAAWGRESDDEDSGVPDQTRILCSKDAKTTAGQERDLSTLLQSYHVQKTWKPILKFLKSISPSKLDIQIRGLDLEAPMAQDERNEDEQDTNLMVTFLTFLADAISSDTDFEFLQALLRAFILIHGDTLAQDENMKEVAKTVEEETHKAWGRICNTLQHTQCLVGLLGSMHQT